MIKLGLFIYRLADPFAKIVVVYRLNSIYHGTFCICFNRFCELLLIFQDIPEKHHFKADFFVLISVQVVELWRLANILMISYCGSKLPCLRAKTLFGEGYCMSVVGVL